MLLAELAQVSLEVAATSARSRKVALLAGLFRDAGPEDVPVVIPYLADGCPRAGSASGGGASGTPSNRPRSPRSPSPASTPR